MHFNNQVAQNQGISSDETSYDHDGYQLRSSIENGQGNNWKHSDQKQNQQLYKEIMSIVQRLNDQSINTRMKKLNASDSREYQDYSQIIKILFTMLVQEKIQSDELIKKRNECDQSDYETLLQKLEAEIRQHIRIEQQLKLYAETIQAKLDDQTKLQDYQDVKLAQQSDEIIQQNEVIKKFNSVINRYEKDIQYLKHDVKKVVKQQPSQSHLPVSNKDLHNYDQLKLDNLHRPIQINLHLDRPNHYRVQTEPSEEFIDQSSMKKKSPYQQRVQTESSDIDTLFKKTLQRDKSKKQTTIQPKIDNQMRRHLSNKSYVDPTYSNQQKLLYKQETLRQKSLSKHSQNSIEVIHALSHRNQILNKTKPNTSIINVSDISQNYHQRPYTSNEKPLEQVDYRNDSRAESKMQEGRISSQENYIQQHHKKEEYSENQQKIKTLIQNFHMRNLTENYSSNKIDERKKKYPNNRANHY